MTVLDQARHEKQWLSEREGNLYAELWGDVVDLRHLSSAMVIGGAISLATYLIAGRIFASFVEKASVAHAYAMLAGLIGCVLGGVVCAWRFKPKRVMVDEDDRAWQRDAVELLVAEAGPLGLSAHLTPAVEREMRELGLFDVVENATRGEAT